MCFEIIPAILSMSNLRRKTLKFRNQISRNRTPGNSQFSYAHCFMRSSLQTSRTSGDVSDMNETPVSDGSPRGLGDREDLLELGVRLDRPALVQVVLLDVH